MSLFSWNAAPSYGLLPIFGTFQDFPLLSSQVHYRIVDVQYHATLRQTYTSRSSRETEVRYTFPLPSDGSVCSYKAVIDGTRTITGVVKTKRQAKQEYDQAIQQGKTATLLEQVNVEVFQVSLGNLRPGQTIEVQMAFVALISQEAGLDSLRITFPTAIGPRYGSPPSTTSSTFGGLFLPAFANAQKLGIDLSVSLEMSSPIRSVASPSHPISTHLGTAHIEAPPADFDPAKAFVQLTSTEWLEKDIVLIVQCADLDKPRCMVESYAAANGAEEDTHAYALTLVPRFDLPPLPKQEFIFLVDRSGSMSGGKMKAVRASLQIMLKSLPTRNTLFNVFSFGSHHSSLWQVSRPYTAETVANASAHVDTMGPDYGGTEIRRAIEAAINSRNEEWKKGLRLDGKKIKGVDTEVPTSIFVLTDGESFDLDPTISMIRDKVKEAQAKTGLLRIFTLGIGNAVSKAMCDSISRAGQGVSVFVGETEKPDQKLMGLLRAARGAPIENLTIDWGVDLPESEPIPATPTTLASGDEDDFELVGSATAFATTVEQQAPLSLFDNSFNLKRQADEEKNTVGAKPIDLPPPSALQVAPSLKTLPSLYPSFRTSIFAITKLRSPSSAPSTQVTIRGTILGRAVELVVPIGRAQAEMEVEGVKMIHVLAARALIQAFEDNKGANSAHGAMTEVDEAEIRRLALRYSLASSQTSFVAVDEVGEPLVAVPRPPTVNMQAQHFQNVPGGGAGLFGSKPTGGAFGSASPGIGIFGGGVAFGGTSAFGSGTGAFGQSAPEIQQRMDANFGGSGFASFGAPSGPQAFGTSSVSPPISLFGGTTAFGARPTGATFGSFGQTGVLSAHAPESRGGVQMMAQTQQQQHTPTTGFGGGLFGSSAAAPQTGGLVDSSSSSAPASASFFGASPTSQSSSMFGGNSAATGQGLFGSGQGLFGGASQPETFGPPVPTNELTIENFARLQAFDGSFPSAPWLNSVVWPGSLPPSVPSPLRSFSFSEDVWRTLLCVAFLERKFKAEKDVWEVMVEKAVDWVRDVIQSAGDVEGLLRALREEAARNVVQ